MNKERGERVVLKEAPVERGLHDPKRAWESGGPGLWGVCGGFDASESIVLHDTGAAVHDGGAGSTGKG